MTYLPPQNLTMHSGQYNLTEDDMGIVASCSCGWRTPAVPVSDDPTNWAERSAAVAAASLEASVKLIAHLEGYPCHGCGGEGELPTKKWEPDIICPTCLGSKTQWPNKPPPKPRYGRRR